MTFFYKGKEYVGATATQIVHEMARDAGWSASQGDIVRGFLRSELARLGDSVHKRDLELARHRSEELLAFNYLCLLDEYGIGILQLSAPA